MNTTTTLINRRFQVALDDKSAFIGQGGVGSVYRGLDTTTQQPVAVKILKRELVAHDPEMVKRFEVEGEALRQLNHPNIVKMLGADDVDGVHYLVMEYVAGGSLRDLLEKHAKLTIQRTLYIALDVADALTRAHRLRILHRDIKPDNVLMAEDGTPRLTDFGMARMKGEPQITQDGAIVGTLAYLAPEVFQGEVPDERADIWAFGVMLWEMLVGQRPYHYSQPAQLINAILTEPLPDLEKAHPELPTALVDLIYRMLSKEHAARIPSVRLIGAELEALIRGDRTTSLQAVVKVEDSTGRFDISTGEFPKVPTSSTIKAPNNLPNQPTPFVGRERELDDLQKLIDSKANIITLNGSGGIGKTRIAVALAEKQLPYFHDGVYFVPFAPIEKAEYILPTIAEAIQFTYGTNDGKQDLVNYLCEKKMLLVFDNFEHLANEAGLVSDIVQAAPNVTIIVTSRERLRLRGEQVYEVDGMNLPTKKDETPEKLSELPAVKLFTLSARRVMPDFELDSKETVQDVAQVIRLVGGLPLGIELAATWLEALPLSEIVTEIERSLDFLETDLRDVPERHRSIRAVFDYSWIPQIIDFQRRI
jgi:serine/threonine protein kinase